MADNFDELKANVITTMKGHYTETTIDHVVNPRNLAEMSNPDGFGITGGDKRTTMKMWLKIKDNMIEDATFWTDGCVASIACGSIATELAKGKAIVKAKSITEYDILNALGGLPEGNVHCAAQAASTLRKAVQDYVSIKNESWKKAYRKY